MTCKTAQYMSPSLYQDVPWDGWGQFVLAFLWHLFSRGHTDKHLNETQRLFMGAFVYHFYQAAHMFAKERGTLANEFSTLRRCV